MQEEVESRSCQEIDIGRNHRRRQNKQLQDVKQSVCLNGTLT